MSSPTIATSLFYPDWVSALATPQSVVSPDEALLLSISLAEKSIEHGGGPFGAVLLDGRGRITSLGWNQTIASHDPTAHAEVTCIRNGCAALQSYTLPAGTRLYTSSAPCILCFGAIWWSNIESVTAGTSTESAERIGFNEGPVSKTLWEAMETQKGTKLVIDPQYEYRVCELLTRYSKSGEVY